MSRRHRTWFLKRALDVTVALLISILLLPVIIVITVLVRLFLGSPVFFRQLRPGLQGKPFKIIKFRTLREGSGGEMNVANDASRMTFLGRLLRALSLDELPELWNVFRGEMSLVGPRPLLMQYLERYTPEQARRHEVLPGITGWAQVHGRNAVTWEEKFKLDVWYVDHWSLALDLKILLLTLAHVIWPRGINSPGSATMTEFMGSATTSADQESR